MPTPFSHMRAAIDLLHHESIPADIHTALVSSYPAYVLGSVAPDARVDAPDPRAATHFYAYQQPMEKHPWLIMLDEYPQLTRSQSEAHRAFLAGYVAHLAMDEIWTLQMLDPYFAKGNWGEDKKYRFFVLHLLLTDMDIRELPALPAGTHTALRQATPDDWLPFMPQSILTDWQNLIYEQIKPDGISQTTEIFGQRINRSADEIDRLVHDEAWMQRELWQHVTRKTLASIEAEMARHASASLVRYMREFNGLVNVSR